MAAIGQTITGVAHNIKNVLQLIQGGLDLFDSNLEHNRVDRLKTNWNIIRKGLDRIGKITHDMLDYAKNRRPEKKYYNINTLIGEVIESTRQTLQDKQIEVLLSLDPDLSDSYLDVDGMYECIVLK